MKVLRLTQARVLLWARRPQVERERSAPRSDSAFEVSKVVTRPLQPACSSAPRCPDEEGRSPFARQRASWIDPSEPPHGSCPYAFAVRGECLRHRNQLALEAALFLPAEARRVRRLLEALGYQVEEEELEPSRAETRILKAHGCVGAHHEARLLQSPGVGSVVLVRELPRAAGPRMRSLPVRQPDPPAQPIGGSR